MVLEDLGKRLTDAFAKMSKATVVDEGVLTQALNAIGLALLQADVNVILVKNLQERVKKAFLNQVESKRVVDRVKFVRHEIVRYLIAMLDPKTELWLPTKRRTNVVMMVGLQGSGKTTSIAKLASRYKKMSWSVGLVCADTFRAGAFDQLKQNAARQGIPFFGSYTERDPVQVALDGVRIFKEQKTELILVDTSGRHHQDVALFEEMRMLVTAIEPDHIVFVMDGSVGQAIKAQAQAFANAVSIGSIILSKMDGHAKGGGALTAVAMTGAPIAYLGVGEHIGDLQDFSAQGFIGQLTGMGNFEAIDRLFREDQKVDEFIKMGDLKTGLTTKLKEGKMGDLTIQDYQEQMQMMLESPMTLNLMAMMPGMGADPTVVPSKKSKKRSANPQGTESDKLEMTKGNIRRTLVLLDSMTPDERRHQASLFLKDKSGHSRIRRIARGSGLAEVTVIKMLTNMQLMVTHWKKVQSKGGGMADFLQPARGLVAQKRQNAQLAKLIPQQHMQALGGLEGLKQLMGGNTGSPFS